MSNKYSAQKTEAMTPREIRKVKKAVSAPGYRQVFFIFLGLMLAGLALLIIGLAEPTTRIALAGGIWFVLSGILAFTIRRLENSYHKDMAGVHQCTKFAQITGKRIDSDSSQSKNHILIMGDLEFDVSEKIFHQYESGETVEIRYTESTGILIDIHKR
jgi:ABC-type transport system involved in cytochrome bd biosynthesis fused ATPase/permease subunit